MDGTDPGEMDLMLIMIAKKKKKLNCMDEWIDLILN